MKQFKLIIAVIFAAAILLGVSACSTPSNSSSGGSSSSSGSSSLNFKDPLFPSSEATENFNGFTYTWADGDWYYQEIQTGSNWKSVNYYELTISNNGQSLSLTKGITYYKEGDEEASNEVPSEYLPEMNTAFQFGMKFWYQKANPERTKFFGHEDEKQDSRKGPHTVDVYLMKK